MKVLTWDVETAPSLAYVFNLWDERIPIDRIVDASEILCFGAKWLDSNRVITIDKRDPEMLAKLHRLISEADATITYNGDSFDYLVANREFALAELGPPASGRSIDLYKTVKKKFKFESNKLDYVCQRLGLGSKQKTGGFETWRGCINNDPKAWARMRKYCAKDVRLTEQLYFRIRPWIDNHPNHNLYSDTAAVVCPNCGGDSLRREGHAYTQQGKFQRFVCRDCGRWSRETRRIEGATIQQVT